MGEICNTRKVRETGFNITMISGLDGHTLVCEEHGFTCSWDTKKDATVFWPYPSEWCEGCAKIIYGEA